MSSKSIVGTGLISAVALLAFILFSVGTVHADLITAGDFESITTANFTQTDLVAGNSSTYGSWHTQPANWIVAAGGPPGSTQYAQHVQNTVRLFQGFDATGLASGTTLNFSFDYIYQQGFTGTEEMAWVLGLTNGDVVNVFAPFATPGDQLVASSLSIQQNWTHFTTSFTLGASYDAIAVVFGMGAFSDLSGLRGVDNVKLAAVPEPATVLLLGSGLVGLVGFGRKRFKK